MASSTPGRAAALTSTGSAISTSAYAPPEYVIVRKLEFYREGGSPKHLRDIRAMLDVSAELIDVATIEDWVRRRGLIEAWSEAQNSRD